MKRIWDCETKNIADKVRFLRREIKKLQREIFGSDKSNHSQYVKEFSREFAHYQDIRRRISRGLFPRSASAVSLSQ
ncbi:MAG TPA: hypothetical protein VGL91_07600 [Acidobacteriota bacterium]